MPFTAVLLTVTVNVFKTVFRWRHVHHVDSSAGYLLDFNYAHRKLAGSV